MDARKRQQLEVDIAAIDRGGTPTSRVDWTTGEVLDAPPAAEAFGRWLLAQRYQPIRPKT